MVSNKNLALLLIVAVVISLGGTLMSLNKVNQLQELKELPMPGKQTGMVAYGGKVNLDISPSSGCVVTNNVSFGAAGQPTSAVNISTERNNGGEGFGDCTSGASGCSGIEINNTGSVNLLVNFSSDVNATGFLITQTGLGSEDFMVKSRNGTGTNPTERPGCINANVTSWSNVNRTTGGTPTTNICTNLTSVNSNDMVSLEFNVTLEPDVTAGTKTALLTINCVQN